MKQTLVTVLKENKIFGNYFFTNIEDGESKFSEECSKLDQSLDQDDLQELLDDGYFNFNEITVCLNSFNHEILPTHGVCYVSNNCIEMVVIHYNYYELKRVFRDVVEVYASNGEDYTSEDIDKAMDMGCENINENKVYFFKI